MPIHIVGAYQDEQTGPRGQTHLFERIGGVPKRLMLTNGDHDTESTADYGVPDIRNDRKAWLDDARKLDLALNLNVHRRHLTVEQQQAARQRRQVHHLR